MTDKPIIRPLGAGDLSDYKQLRDDMLFAHPEAFTSDANAEREKEPADYLHRFGLDRRGSGHFVLGAWGGTHLIGAIGCERELRRKVQHIGHVIGMMVRPEARGRGVGRDLLDACVAEARRAPGLEMLTLTVTAGNAAAIALYESSGFVAYGTLSRALKLGSVYHDKLHMSLTL
jgi:ribosomal protein S18 acetylase RimI-like enzyme